MKTKFSRILGVVAVIALLASFLAVPVLADVSSADVDLDNEEISATTDYTITFDVTDEVVPAYTFDTAEDSTASWDTESEVGDYSVLLNFVTEHTYVDFVPDSGTTLADLTVAGGFVAADWDFWYKHSTANFGPQLELKFTEPGTSNFVDVTFMLQDQVVQGAWTSVNLTDVNFGNIGTWDGSTSSSNATLADAITALGSITLEDYDLTKVRVELYDDPSTARTCYIDDVTIDGTTYDVEPDAAITIELPEGTVFADTWGNDDVTVQSGEGLWGGDANPETSVGDNVFTTEDPDDVWTVTIDLAQLAKPIAEGATVRVTFLNTVTNPDTAGDYTLWVNTSAEEDPVESETYTIEVPDVDVLPGVVEVYNPSDVLMSSYTGGTAIASAIAAADEGWTIKIGEGLYDEDPDTADTDVTFEGSGDVEDIVIEGTWTINVAEITIDGLTLDGGGANNVLVVTANDFILQNSVLEDADVALIDDDGSTADDPTIIDNCIFNIEDEIGVDVGTAGVEITDSTFNVEVDGTGVGIEINADAEVSDSTFNGGSGVGVQVEAGVSEISGSSFDGLEIAFDINGGTVDINTNTIQNCEGIAIDVAAATLVTIHNNTITGNDDDDILQVTANADLVFLMFNTITDNAGDGDLLIDNNDGGTDLFVVNNWWDSADGPTQGEDAFSDDVEFEPYLPGPISNSAIEALVDYGVVADFEDATGVTVESTAGGVTGDFMDIVGAAQYTANPVDAIDDAVGYWDVSVTGSNADITEITVRLYTDVTDDTEVWVWGEARGEWLEASNYTPNLFAGFVGITVTDDSVPTIADLAALPFVVVEPAAGTADAPAIVAPTVGAVDVSTTPTLAWDAIDDATYDIQISQDNTFGILDESGTSPTNAYIVKVALAEGSSYYWRVRPVTDAGAGDWATGVFTTATPVEPTPPIIIEETEPPEITVTMPAAQVTAAIPDALLWSIIGVGAVLVIALIVLIVRTRRTV